MERVSTDTQADSITDTAKTFHEPAKRGLFFVCRKSPSPGLASS